MELNRDRTRTGRVSFVFLKASKITARITFTRHTSHLEFSFTERRTTFTYVGFFFNSGAMVSREERDLNLMCALGMNSR